MKSTILVSTLAVALSVAALAAFEPKEPKSSIVATGYIPEESGRSRRVCRLLARLSLEAPRASVNAREQLIASTRSVFGDDPAVLGQLAMTIDEAAIEQCPADRNNVLSKVDSPSLQEAAGLSPSWSAGPADARSGALAHAFP